jgi:predicted DNA-binding transcriptional regulator AlpA
MLPARFGRAKHVAGMLRINVSTVWRWTESGRLPRPIRIGAVTMWDLDKVAEAVRTYQ